MNINELVTCEKLRDIKKKILEKTVNEEDIKLVTHKKYNFDINELTDINQNELISIIEDKQRKFRLQ